VKGAAEFPQKTFRNAYTLVIMFVSFAIVAFGSYAYTNHVRQQSDHQWCELLVIAARPLPASPKPTADQIHGRELLKKLARDKGCIK